ncbi:hypothetical protein [Paenibacillus sinopodophylli]|uniref:hypothetical protein n=1 Tax=Paenibacillus sinopodophylli TaxID=1837342 RepID=UPI00110CBFBF|nr:hypothetical protein [Paenibacillus sinopodophylli]
MMEAVTWCGICDLISTEAIFLLGDYGGDIIDYFVNGYSHRNIEIRAPLIYITTGILLLIAAPKLTQYITRKAEF